MPGTSRSPLKPVLSGKLRRTPRPEPLPQRSLRSTHKSTPLQPEQSLRRTPKLASSRSQRSSNLTPALLQPKTARALRSLNTKQQNGSASQPTRSDGLENVTKKRKLSVTSSGLDIQRSSSNLPGKPSLVLTELKSPEAILGVEADVADSVLQLDQENDPADIQHVADATVQHELPKKRRKKRKSIGQNSKTRTRKAHLDLPSQQDHGNHSTDSQQVAGVVTQHEPSQKKRKKRKSIGQNSKKQARKAQLSPTSQQEIDVLDVQPSLTSEKAGESHRVPSVLEDADLADPLKAISRKLKGKRGKSIGRLPISPQKLNLGNSSAPANHTNPSVDIIEDVSFSLRPTTERIERTLGNQFVSTDDKGEEKESGDEALKDRGKKVDLESVNNGTQPRSQPRKSDLASEKEGRGVSAQREAPSRAKIKRTKRTFTPASSARVQKQSRKHQLPKNTGNSIPITVYRLSKKSAFVEDDLVGPNPLPRKVGVNAVDVLGQICREMVAKALGTVDDFIDKGQNSSSQAEQKRVRKAIEMFGDELDSQVFQMVCLYALA